MWALFDRRIIISRKWKWFKTLSSDGCCLLFQIQRVIKKKNVERISVPNLFKKKVKKNSFKKLSFYFYFFIYFIWIYYLSFNVLREKIYLLYINENVRCDNFSLIRNHLINIVSIYYKNSMAHPCPLPSAPDLSWPSLIRYYAMLLTLMRFF